MPLRLDATKPGFAAAFDAFVGRRRGAEEDVSAAVAAILAEVRRGGDAAVAKLTHRFDRHALPLRVPVEEIDAAEASVDDDTLDALDHAAERIEAFHTRQRPQGFSYTDDEGVRLGLRWTAIDAVGIYVPGGLASYPSSVLMNAIPARIAGVSRIAMAVPTPDGALNPLVLAAARRASVDEIWRIGGAQAVAAFAYGTASIAPVDKIVGPGNAYVAEAKRQVFGRVGIDMIAGPSEILVVADAENDPDTIAMDLLSQAEHDEDAQAILITDSLDYATEVEASVEGHLEVLPRAKIAGASWREHGAIILVDDLMNAAPLIDRIAPEHLELAVADPEPLFARIRHAGAVFMGRNAPEAVGDYVAGPNHVLPTARSARFSSGLGVTDFMKRTTWVDCGIEALQAIGPAAVVLADAEGLEAHAASLALRLAEDG